MAGSGGMDCASTLVDAPPRGLLNSRVNLAVPGTSLITKLPSGKVVFPTTNGRDIRKTIWVVICALVANAPMVSASSVYSASFRVNGFMESPCAWILHARIFLIRWDVHSKKRRCTGTPRPSRDRATAQRVMLCSSRGSARRNATGAGSRGPLRGLHACPAHRIRPRSDILFVRAGSGGPGVSKISGATSAALRGLPAESLTRGHDEPARLRFAEQAVGRDFIWP